MLDNQLCQILGVALAIPVVVLAGVALGRYTERRNAQRATSRKQQRELERDPVLIDAEALGHGFDYEGPTLVLPMPPYGEVRE